VYTRASPTDVLARKSARVGGQVGEDCRACPARSWDCETIRIPPLMSKRTIRIPGEVRRRRRRGVDGTWGGT